MTSTTAAGEPRHLPAGFAGRVRRAPRALWRGRETDALWIRPAWLGLLAVAAVLYVWDLAASGWANAFYSAAVQAGTKSWVAFFYGSSDAGNSITVDKPPASLWLMELSARVFGLSPWSILLPEAILGVVTVALVFAIVRRHFPAPAALIAGAATALTPVAVLMFRFNNPDALLVALVTAAVYFVVRGIDDGRIRWIVWAGVALGFAFLTKQLQGWLVVPVLGLVYLYASPRSIGKRLLHLAAGLAAIVVSAGWWVAVVELVPAALRPFIGGSQSNDFLQLTFGYNGFGRLTGNETGSVTGGRGGAGAWGETGLTRLFGSEFGGQVSWLLLAALILGVAGIVVLWRRPRVDGQRATLLLLGGSLIITAAAFSFGAGIIHPYYSVALAPFIGGLVGAGSALLWQRRARLRARIVAVAVVLVSAAWSFSLLGQAAGFVPWLKWVVLVAGLVGGAALLTATLRRALAGIAITASLVAGLAGPAAFAVDTTLTAHTGSIPSAGPAVAGRGGFGGGQGFARGGFGGQRFGQGGQGFGGRGGFGGGQAPGGAGTRGGFGGTGGFARGGFGGAGGLLGGSTTISSAVKTALETDASKYTWVAAAVGSQNAASYQLATGEAVMPLGGFNGSDPSPTLAQFEQYVKAGRIHYFISSGRGIGASNGGSSDATKIQQWVASNFTATTIGGTTVYDLTSPSSGTSSSSTSA